MSNERAAHTKTPERIWILQAVADSLGMDDFIVPEPLRERAVEYVRADSHDALRAEVAALKAALEFCASLAGEELEYVYVGTGAEVALRHIERRARAAISGEKES
jgi:hypothetical protein